MTPAADDSPARQRVLDLFPPLDDEDVPTTALTAAEVGEQLGLHVTTARFHLDGLVRDGQLEASSERRGVGRPRKVFRRPAPTEAPSPSAEAFRALTELLVTAWEPSGDGPQRTPEEAGRDWAHRHRPLDAGEETTQAHTAGAWLGKIGQTVDLLQKWGYQPEIRTTEDGRTAEITLRGCPFASLARAHPHVVCGVHRGLLGGALSALGEDDTEVELEPFVTPHSCRARLTTHARFDS